jgi:hypothetical protein
MFWCADTLASVQNAGIGLSTLDGKDADVVLRCSKLHLLVAYISCFVYALASFQHVVLLTGWKVYDDYLEPAVLAPVATFHIVGNDDQPTSSMASNPILGRMFLLMLFLCFL